MKRLQRGIAPLITVFCRRFVTSWEIACDCAATVTHTDKGGWLSCTQRHQVSSVIQMPALSWKEWQVLGKLFVPPLTWEGKFHLYTCKCALHSFTVYVSFPLLSLGVKKKRFWIHLMHVCNLNKRILRMQASGAVWSGR